MGETILVERDGAIATVTLNKPERLNALDRSMWVRLGGIFGELDRDESLRCIVLRGAGDKAFAAGGERVDRPDRLDRPGLGRGPGGRDGECECGDCER